jgi:DNA polymerase I
LEQRIVDRCICPDPREEGLPISTMLLIDGGLIFRNFFAMPPMTDPTGRPVGAVFGFAAMTLREIAAIQPTHMVVTCDVPIAENRRTAVFADYKGNRDACPPELAPQFEILREVLTALNIKWLQAPGYEADDLMGTMSRVAEEAGIDEVSILTGDRDVFQLLSSRTQVRYVKTLNRAETYDVARYATTYGLLPSQVPDFKGLAGDASDNIPGIRGIGEKTAVKLLQEFHTVENTLDNAHTQKGKLRERLETGREIALLSKQLATIDRYVPDLPDLAGCELALDLEGGKVKFEQLRFRSLMGRLVG